MVIRSYKKSKKMYAIMRTGMCDCMCFSVETTVEYTGESKYSQP